MIDEIKKTGLTKETIEVLDIYATKRDLNDEANIRADSDSAIIKNVELLRRIENSKFENVNLQLGKQEAKINNLDEKATEIETQVKVNQDHIANIEGCFFERIKELENEKKILNSQLNQADKKIEAKNDEIKKLKDEIASNGAPNEINLRFAETLEFKVTEVISVKEFINQQLKDMVSKRMQVRYPDAEFSKDYTILLDGLDYATVMQGSNVSVIVRANSEGKLVGESSFIIKVSYSYSTSQQEKFVEELLFPAIPVSLRNVAESASPDYNILNEIIETKPLKLLINNKNCQQLPFKIFVEMNAASYWTDFHRSWQYVRDGYIGTGQSTIGGSSTINSVRNLYNNISGYHHSIFKLIEQRINDSGVACTITKKWVRHSRSDSMLHSLGNLTFNVSNISLDDDEVLMSKSQCYYLMVNFELTIGDNIKKFYRGVTLALSDGLELY